jgi:hypothetical protein
MSQEQVQRLEALLTRVQSNRRATRTIAGMPSPAPMMRPSPVAAAANLDAKPRGAPTATAGRPAATAAKAAEAPAARATEPNAPVKPAAEATAARSAGLPSPAAAPRPRPEAAVAARARESSPPAISARESSPPAVGARGAPPAQPAIPPAHAKQPTAPDEVIEPTVIEPEPMREPARPIAQVVSRHAPQADATFGAMLKRSLSLRPH